jgi:DNA helicase-2/ATP-dependent DNA helicase PcrA
MAETEADVEEERRLFYVAITRAEKRCLLTYARTRFRYGQLQFGTRSRFLNEIDPSYLTGGQGSRQASGQVGYRPSSGQGYGPSGRQGYGPSRQTPTQKPMSSSTTPTSTSAPSLTAASTPRRWVSLGERSAVSSRPSSSSSSSSSSSNLQPGSRIEHERFGQGSVVKIEGDGENAKAVIRFDNVGEKTLLLKFARIKLL